MERTKLATARYKKRLTQERAAELLGVTRNTLSKWERGVVTPYPIHIHRLCEVYEKSALELGLLDEDNASSKIEEPLTTKEEKTAHDKSTLHELNPVPTEIVLQDSIWSSSSLPTLEATSLDLPTWFGARVNELKAVGAYGQDITYQQQQKTIYAELESWNTMTNPDHQPTNEFLKEYYITRRTVLAGLAFVSVPALKWMRSGSITAFISKEFLAQCATSITTCYTLLKGDGITTVEHTLPQYLPQLINLAKSPSLFQKDAAYLASQGCHLMCTIKHHRLQFREQVICSKQSVEFARLAGNSQLVATALTHLGVAWFNVDQPEKYLRDYQEAEHLLEEDGALFPPRLQSRIYMGLSDAHTLLGHAQEAQHYLDLANDILLYLHDDLYIPALNYDLSYKVQMEGVIQRELGELKDQNQSPSQARSYYEQADKALAQIASLPPSVGITEHVRVQINNDRGLVAVKLNDIESFKKHFIKGAQGAKVLGSQKRRQEAITIWQAAKQRWPNEKRITEMVDVLL